MKHTLKITLILIAMFFIAQTIGIFVANAYTPETISTINQTTGEQVNITAYDIPYGLEPPQGIEPVNVLWQILIAIVIVVVLMLILMRIRAEIFLRIWFLVVVTLGLALALNGLFIKIPNSALLAIIIAIPLAIIKIFQRNLVVHNLTELLIYPGIAIVFIPLLNIWTVVLLLILISIYDIYAVWHAGFMQKMAKYQIEKLRIFSGFFVPYADKKTRAKIKIMKQSNSKSKKDQKIGVHLAILGGGDVVFPIILAGVVLYTFGSLLSAFIIAIGATIALGLLFYYSEKGKFYPAMPFITTGCLIALGIVYLIN